MVWSVEISKKAEKAAVKLPKRFKNAFLLLIRDLKLNGPTLSDWPNYGKLKGKKNDLRHCHLVRRSKPTYVVCWEVLEEERNGKKCLKITYVGTHEKAPY